jgi:MFS family permease
VAVLLSLSVISFFWTAVPVLRFPYVVDYGEAPLVDQSNRVLSHQVIYKSDFSKPPYIVANYPPIYILLQAGLAYLTGAPLLLSGRIISIFASIASAGILASLAKSLTESNLSFLVAMGLFLGHPYVITWSALARVDLLALLFCLLGIFILYHRWYSWRWLCLALVCLLASIYTRQSYLLAGPMAASCWLWNRDRRKARIFMALLILMTILLFLTINFFSHGGFFLHIIRANINEYKLSILGDWLKQFILIWPIISIGIIAVAYQFITQYKQNVAPRLNPFIIWCILVFFVGGLLASLTVGKVGSGANYFIELISAGAVLGSLALHQIRMIKWSRKFIFLLLGCGQLIWLLAGAVYLNRVTINNTWESMDRYNQIAKRIEAAAMNGPILSDDYLGVVVELGQSIYYQPFEYGQLYHAGIWDPIPLAEEIKSGRFSLILIGGDTLDKPCCWPPELVTAIKDSYQIIYQPGIVACYPMP